MKNSIIKFRHSIIALLMIVLNGVGAWASTPWTVNPSDYRYDMSLYLDVSFATVRMDYSQYDVAVFCGDQCRGIAEVLPLGNGEECLYLRTRSNQESGENMTFKYYNKVTEEIQPIDGVSFSFESNGRLGYPSDPYIVKIIRHFDVTFSAGSGGSINQESGRVAEGTVLTITATPSEGYHFDRWSDGNTDNPRTITVDADIILAAEFGVNTYKLIYNVDGNLYKEYDINYGTAILAEAIPEKEGHTFSGWEGLPETMPAHDVTVSGSFSINSYNAVFKIGDDVIETKIVVFGLPVVSPEAPAKEGHTFAGWQNVPETMPAHDIEILGSYNVNSYKLTYVLDGENWNEVAVEYGATIVAEIPEKEGHSFSGWEGLPETMPAHDVTVTGSFSINSYNAVFKIGDDVIETKIVVFGLPVVSPEAPAKEGHTFAGWQNVPETMPAHDIEILGSYNVNSYKLTYVLDGENWNEVAVEYGATIVAEIPEKEGHSFSGWEGLPETMPAHDVTVSGSFSINSYWLTLYLNNEIYHSELIEFGALVIVEDPEVPEGMKFDGWRDDIPELMPAHDVDIHGTYSTMSSITSTHIDIDSIVTVCSLSGYPIYNNVRWGDIEHKLDNNLYIINGNKVLIRKYSN